MSMNYFGGHNHTQYSNITAGLDSINKLPDLVAKAKALGLTGIAITNHDNLSEVIEINRFQKKLQKDGDDFILAIGNEIYLIDGYAVDELGKAVRQKYYHMVLIAKDKIGYDAIVELSSAAWYRSEVRFGRRRVPTFKCDVERMMERAKGHIIATSACLGGELPTKLNAGDFAGADTFVEWCLGTFGYDDFYIELQPSPSPDQNKFNKLALERYPDVQITIATDAHYQDKEDFPIFEAFMRSQQEQREVQEYYEFARLMSKEEALTFFKDYNQDFIEQGFQNTLKMQSQIEFYDLAQEPKIPKVPNLIQPERTWMNPKTTMDIKEYPTLQWAASSTDEQTAFCIHTCLNQLLARNLWNKQYLDRLEEEFEVMKFQSDQLHDNFFAYANTMRHYLDMAWSIDCAVGPSRGSASGSLLNYLMDIVQCDPIQYELPFWRYLNKTRVTPLDIDTDFQPSKRAELFAAIRRERGELGLTQVATYRTLTLKAAIGNAARGYRAKDCPNGLDPDISTYISSLIEIKRGFVATLKQTLEGDETTGYNVNHNFIKECNQYPGLLEIIRKIEGLVVGSGTHAAAVVLFDDHDRLFDHCSLMRAPNGDLCTALDLHTVEEAGCYKYDFLLLSTLDIQATCFKLLQHDKVIDPSLTLKECFRKYINPNTLDFNNPLIWEKLYNNEVLSIFQWDAASGRKGIIATRPQSLAELTAVNGLIRLMTTEDDEDQIARFVKIKENPELFEEEMLRVGLSDEQRRIMHEELDQYNGCAATQESFMVLSQRLAEYTLKQADALRKTVAKKKMNEITAQKELWWSQLEGNTETVKEYLWRVIIAPSLGYGFSLNHALPYSIIGVQCILMGGVLFKPIYWQTACLLQRSGALDGKTADYNKIAKAVSMLAQQGVNIKPIDINKSERSFTLDAERNIIHFGLEGLKGLKTKSMEAIINNRPFTSMFDFIVRTGSDITSVVALLKAGAFDDFGPREELIDALAKYKCGQKEKLNGQNYLMLSRDGFWPQDTPELVLAQRIFNFTQYLKSCANEDILEDAYPLDERSVQFLDELGYQHNGESLLKKSWKYSYDRFLQPMKEYLLYNQQEMVDKVNQRIVQEWKEKYFPNNDFAQWEIETMGLCFQEHPMAHVINVSDFNDLPQEPVVANIFRPKNSRRSIPIYSLTMICGIVIAKDKLHSSITLLTPTGPVEVKFRKEQFAHYDSQISQQVNGKKQIVERSWLNRGVGLIVHGMRQDDQFIAKTYRNSPMEHTAFKITKVLDTGKIEVQKERMKGKEEENNDEDNEE